MQTAPVATYLGVWDCAVKTVRSAGLASLYSGASAGLAASVIENTAVFAANEALKKWARGQQADPAAPLSSTQLCGIGAVAGFFQTLLTCPFNVVKCQLQVHGPGMQQTGARSHGASSYTGPLDCIRKMAACDGIAAFYRGWSAWVSAFRRAALPLERRTAASVGVVSIGR